MRSQHRGLELLTADPPRPFVAIVGGAALATHEGLLRSLLLRCDRVHVVGPMLGELLAPPPLRTPAAASLLSRPAARGALVLPASVQWVPNGQHPEACPRPCPVTAIHGAPGPQLLQLWTLTRPRSRRAAPPKCCSGWAR